jgi:mRNA-degrading endonuclease RelE of RelBE toxin-antitoxin system
MRIKEMQLTRPVQVAASQLISSVRPTLPGAIRNGYTLARVRYEVVLAPEAVGQLLALPARLRSQLRDAIERHLRHEPTELSKGRIKRLRGLDQPQYRLRVEETRVFYDVKGDTVEVLAIVPKAQAHAWLDDEGVPSEAGGPGEGQG